MTIGHDASGLGNYWFIGARAFPISAQAGLCIAARLIC